MTGREIRIETLGDLLDGGYDLTWYCGNDKCGRTLDLTLARAIELFGRDRQFISDPIPAKCSVCGSRKISKSLRAPGTGLGLFRAT